MPQISPQLIARIFGVLTDDDVVATIARRLETAAALTRRAGLDDRTYQKALEIAADMGHDFSGEALAGIARLVSRNQESFARGLAHTYDKVHLDEVLSVLGRTQRRFSDEAIEGMLDLAERSSAGTVQRVIDAVNEAWQVGGLLAHLPPAQTLQHTFEDFRYIVREWPMVRGIDDLADDLGQFFTHRYFGSWHQLVYLRDMRRFLTSKMPGISPGDIDLLQVEKHMNRMVQFVDAAGTTIRRRMMRRFDQEVSIRGARYLQELKSFTWDSILARLNRLPPGSTPSQFADALEEALLHKLGRTHRNQPNIVQPNSFAQLHDMFHLARTTSARFQLVLFRAIPGGSFGGIALREHFKQILRKHIDPAGRYIQDIEDILLDGVN